LEWDDKGVEGASRFLKRLWNIATASAEQGFVPLDAGSLTEQQKAVRRKLHETLRKVSDDIGRRYTFNTAIAAVMELLNELGRFDDHSEQGKAVMHEAIIAVVLMLSPIVPHICQSLWQQLGYVSLVAEQAWPEVDESALERDSIELVVQVNGKLRSKINVPADADNDAIENIALKDEKIQLNIQDKTVRKVIVVPGRLVNLVVA
ncbi:MAG: class I tRNA ligase family protein, partial [Gammaproteobacteria bacterium]|nr:class I tRNA ligase family protein [Gammaproteobacteria bacterium]